MVVDALDLPRHSRPRVAFGDDGGLRAGRLEGCLHLRRLEGCLRLGRLVRTTRLQSTGRGFIASTTRNIPHLVMYGEVVACEWGCFREVVCWRGREATFRLRLRAPASYSDAVSTLVAREFVTHRVTRLGLGHAEQVDVVFAVLAAVGVASA